MSTLSRAVRSVLILAVLADAASTGLAQSCGPRWTPLVPGDTPNDQIWSITRWDPDGNGPAGTTLVVGGIFTAVGTLSANRIAVFDPSTGAWSTLGSGFVNGGVAALAVLPDGSLIAGGSFTASGATPTPFIARWTGNAWQALGGGTNGNVSALRTLANGDLIAGGFFSNAGAISVTNVARWSGGMWSRLGGGGLTTDRVTSITQLPNGDLIAGGWFTKIDGVNANRVARWNGIAWSALGTGTNGEVSSVGLNSAGQLVVGGLFTSAGFSASHLARWTGTSWVSVGGGTSDNVTSLALLASGDLVAGGWFTLAGGSPASFVAKYNGTAWSPLGGGLSNIPYAILPLGGGDMAVVGAFAIAGGVTVNRLARWTESGAPSFLSHPQAVSAAPGASPTFAAGIAAGTPGVTFTWNRNGSPVNLADPRILVSASSTSSSLTISNVTSGDAGAYTLVAASACGDATSTSAQLTVHPACPGDINGDGLVDDVDFSLFARAYDLLLCTDPAMPPGCPSDLNQDSIVDDQDFGIFVIGYDALVCP